MSVVKKSASKTRTSAAGMMIADKNIFFFRAKGRVCFLISVDLIITAAPKRTLLISLIIALFRFSLSVVSFIEK